MRPTPYTASPDQNHTFTIYILISIYNTQECCGQNKGAVHDFPCEVAEFSLNKQPPCEIRRVQKKRTTQKNMLLSYCTYVPSRCTDWYDTRGSLQKKKKNSSLPHAFIQHTRSHLPKVKFSFEHPASHVYRHLNNSKQEKNDTKQHKNNTIPHKAARTEMTANIWLLQYPCIRTIHLHLYA